MNVCLCVKRPGSGCDELVGFFWFHKRGNDCLGQALFVFRTPVDRDDRYIQVETGRMYYIAVQTGRRGYTEELHEM